VTRRSRILVGSAVGLVVVLGVAVGIVAASGGGGTDEATKKTTTTTTVPPTTTTAPPPNAPLTGLPDPSGTSLQRPALSVKVENHPEARPQAALDQADVVYEEEVEGGITRFLAIFNSTVPDVVGPVRSVRFMDPDLVWPLGGIFAYSGGAPGPVAAINAAPVHTVDETAGKPTGALIRNAPGQPPRAEPHNLYGIGPALFAMGGQPVPPPPLFQYLAADNPRLVPSDLAPGVLSFRVGFDAGFDPTWVWDAGLGTWKRFLQGQPFNAVSGAQIAPNNVVIQFTQYPAASQGISVGEGDAWIFSDGTLRVGRWVRPDRSQPARYVDANGLPILLRPGRTWVELLPVGRLVVVQRAPVAPTTTAPPPTTTKAKKNKNK
jgi:Protein of unknown function (DUF3048) N-terminal domain/Protein of unknown function (DUF3048) C-terminal domain